MERFSSAKGVRRTCPYDYTLKVLTGTDLPPRDKVSRDICENSEKCNIQNCPLIEAYNAID